MVGNDVVDLRDPELLAHPGGERFDARVFGPSERRRIDAALDPVRVRWALWAAKEAAFKLAVKRAPGLAFRPIRFEVAEDDASVAIPGQAPCALRIGHAGDHLHAVAWDEERPPLASTGRIASEAPEAQSRGARELALRALARAGVDEPRIGREGRRPVLCCAGGTTRDLSLSHHGRVVAFAASAVRAPGARSAA